MPNKGISWQLGAEALYEVKRKTVTEAIGQVLSYGDIMQAHRMRVVYGFTWTMFEIQFFLIDESKAAYISDTLLLNEETLKLVYLICTRATHIPSVEIEGRTDLLSITNTGIVLGRRRVCDESTGSKGKQKTIVGDAVKMPIGDENSYALIENELKRSEEIHKDGLDLRFTRVQRLFTDEEAGNSRLKKYCVIVEPLMEGDLKAFLAKNKKDTTKLVPVVKLIRAMHETKKLLHNDTRLENILYDGSTFRIADFGYAGRFGMEFKGGAPRIFLVDGFKSSPRQDVRIFLCSVLYQFTDSHKDFTELKSRYDECADEEIYDFAEKWLQEPK